MRTTKIKIRNLFGITETELDGRSVELTGSNGVGKTSVIDAFRYALTNKSDRKVIVRQGEKEGEILIETDTGMSISRKKRIEQSDYKSVKENGREIMAPENFLKTLFTPLQLDPVAFTLMDEKSKNRAILDLVEFDWDLNYINEQFGEIPSWVNYDQNILEVLSDMQSENGEWFKSRQNLNRIFATSRHLSLILQRISPITMMRKSGIVTIWARHTRSWNRLKNIITVLSVRKYSAAVMTVN